MRAKSRPSASPPIALTMNATPQPDVKQTPTPRPPTPLAPAKKPTERSTKQKSLPVKLRAPRQMPRPTLTAIAQQQPLPINKLNKPEARKPPLRPTPTATAPQPPPRICKQHKPSTNAKNFAPNCSLSST